MWRPWLLVLDEPTNDLDVESIERLGGALGEYEGALLYVTHDDIFARSVGGRIAPWDWGSFASPSGEA